MERRTAEPVPTATREAEPAATATPQPTSAPPPLITAKKLYAEREANATRFDDTYKDKLITITGKVGEIDSSTVKLIVDDDLFEVLDTVGFEYVALNDVARDVQVTLNKGQEITAICKVGSYILGTINLDDCKVQ